MREIQIVKVLLEELLGVLEPKRISAVVKRDTPEEIIVSGRDYTGVVFKENHWPGWAAEVISGNKSRNVPIFTAGPEQMYIPIPKDLRSNEIKVLLNYKGHPLYWLFFLVSVSATLIAFIYLIFGEMVIKKINFQERTKEYVGKYCFKINQWWKREDE
jgi:hypothetical protein